MRTRIPKHLQLETPRNTAIAWKRTNQKTHQPIFKLAKHVCLQFDLWTLLYLSRHFLVYASLCHCMPNMFVFSSTDLLSSNVRPLSPKGSCWCCLWQPFPHYHTLAMNHPWIMDESSSGIFSSIIYHIWRLSSICLYHPVVMNPVVIHITLW